MERSAAIVRIVTGRGTGDALWGSSALVLRWIGDPPSPEIAQAVYDLVRDGGPRRKDLTTVIESQMSSESQPSYRVARPS
jgi:hypothetical protein